MFLNLTRHSLHRQAVTTGFYELSGGSQQTHCSYFPTTMTPDLPVEIWLYIVSMLPRDHIRKLVGINRMLFSLAMDEIYREVRYIDNNQVMRKTFHQLKYPTIARRVQRVYIRPGFFPEMEIFTKAKLSYLGRLRLKVFRLGRKASSPQPTLDPQEDALIAAGHGLANCTAVEELTIALHDLHPPPSFASFLKTIWVLLAPNLRRLTIDATLPKFALLLNPALLQAFPNLTDLHISIAFSRLSPKRQRDPRVILPFANAVSGTILHLKISSSEVVDFGDLFYGLTCFPNLQKLGVYIPLNSPPSKVHPALGQFIQLHTKSLQDLTVVPLDAMMLQDALRYRAWVMELICGLDFPLLRSLHIGLLMGYMFNITTVPPFSSIRLPQLVSLTLVDAYLPRGDIEAIFNGTFNGNCLESLRIGVEKLSSRILLILAERLPHLTSLDMTFRRRSGEPFLIQDAYDSYDVSPRHDTLPYIDPPQLEFERRMSGCDLKNWKVRNLKLSRVRWSSCALPHYDLRTMETVARCLSFPVIYGVRNYCACTNKHSQGVLWS
ncbi:hypothetical protein BDZ94DRAFT_1248515 [Collybia nuda]|uniref:F-box domain-containing protein n=1 Tax=Collybia nuda TaxID=64659 RepID=A0A9P6CIG5_9AGAR|nr:hypothetical protein BDZ94DRAFT_1248515 [Collybia nuda]